jgi:hypothetical protein
MAEGPLGCHVGRETGKIVNQEVGIQILHDKPIGVQTRKVICRGKSVDKIGKEILEVAAVTITCATLCKVSPRLGSRRVPLLPHLYGAFQHLPCFVVMADPIILTEDGSIFQVNIRGAFVLSSSAERHVFVGISGEEDRIVLLEVSLELVEAFNDLHPGLEVVGDQMVKGTRDR